MKNRSAIVEAIPDEQIPVSAATRIDHYQEPESEPGISAILEKMGLPPPQID